MVLSRTGILFAAILGMLEIAASPSAADYTVTDLGTLPIAGYYGSEAYGINASGQVVGDGFSNIGGGFPEASIWQNGRMSSLGTGLLTRAVSINATGQVVGQGGNNGFLWQNGRVIQSGLGVPFAINDSGQVVGNNSSGAYVWQNGTFTQLGPGGARGINASGQIVGSSNWHAVLWQNGTVTDLGTLGGNFSDANGINASGIVVGLSLRADQSTHAFLWQGGTMTDLGPGIAHAINDTGLVVGETGDEITELGHAFLSQNGMTTDLNSLIPPDSGWTLWDARALNDAGQIVGRGIHNGVTRGFLLTPNQAPVPEPRAILLLAIGMLGLIAWK